MAEGKWYPLSYRQWVEQQAAQGDRAAVSQLRGWDYRDRRSRNKDKDAQLMLIVVSFSANPEERHFLIMLQNLKLVFRKMEVFISGIRGQEKMSVRITEIGLCSTITRTEMNWQRSLI